MAGLPSYLSRARAGESPERFLEREARLAIQSYDESDLRESCPEFGAALRQRNNERRMARRQQAQAPPAARNLQLTVSSLLEVELHIAVARPSLLEQARSTPCELEQLSLPAYVRELSLPLMHAYEALPGSDWQEGPAEVEAAKKLLEALWNELEQAAAEALRSKQAAASTEHTSA